MAGGWGGFVQKKGGEPLSPATLCAVVQFDNVPSLTNLMKLGFSRRVTANCGDYTFTYITREI